MYKVYIMIYVLKNAKDVNYTLPDVNHVPQIKTETNNNLASVSRGIMTIQENYHNASNVLHNVNHGKYKLIYLN